MYPPTDSQGAATPGGHVTNISAESTAYIAEQQELRWLFHPTPDTTDHHL